MALRCPDAFQSTLPARGATTGRWAAGSAPSDFNPRSPHGERHEQSGTLLSPLPFQSTLPARGATRDGDGGDLMEVDFNPRSPHGERPATDAATLGALLFQSTLPARGATSRPSTSLSKRRRFQSTLPARGATRGRIFKLYPRKISIHAPRTGSDRYLLPR